MVCRGLTCRTGSYLFNLQKQAIQVYGINSIADHSWTFKVQGRQSNILTQSHHGSLYLKISLGYYRTLI